MHKQVCVCHLSCFKLTGKYAYIYANIQLSSIRMLDTEVG